MVSSLHEVIFGCSLSLLALGEIGEDDGGSIGTSAQEESQDEKNNLNIGKDNISVSSSASGEQLGMEQTGNMSYSSICSTPIHVSCKFVWNILYIMYCMCYTSYVTHKVIIIPCMFLTALC